MQINQSGIDIIKQFEGCKLEAYKDIAGIWTCGYGATGSGVYPGVVWSQEQAESRLKDDLERFSLGVADLITVSLTDNQFSALVCFSYNVGLAALARSRLLDYANSQQFSEAADQFVRWDKSNGVEVPGLTRRRLAEKSLFQQDSQEQ